MDYTKLIQEIVECLLDETTLLQAYKRGDISGNKIKDASRMRNIASEFYGRKIPVLSNDRIGKQEGQGSYAQVYDTPRPKSRLVDAVPYEDWGNYDFEAKKDIPTSNTEKLTNKLNDRKKSHVVLDTDDPEILNDPRPTLGHELAHIIDVVQRTPEHVKDEREGRISVHMDALKQRRQMRTGLFDVVEPKKEVKKTLKSEGRAWRFGREIQRMATIPNEITDREWKETAQNKLRTYTEPYIPFHWGQSAFRK